MSTATTDSSAGEVTETSSTMLKDSVVEVVISYDSHTSESVASKTTNKSNPAEDDLASSSSDSVSITASHQHVFNDTVWMNNSSQGSDDDDVMPRCGLKRKAPCDSKENSADDCYGGEDGSPEDDIERAARCSTVVPCTPSRRLSKRFYVEDMDDEAVQSYYDCMLKNAARTRPKAFFMKRQTLIDDSHRFELINWLAEVVAWFGMNDESLFLAVNYLDRFFCKMRGTKRTLQLLGTAALFVAAKYEETSPPACEDFAAMISEDVRNSAINNLELTLLSTIDFDLCVATSRSFLKFVIAADRLPDNEEETQNHALKTCELSLLDSNLSQYSPHLIGFACWSLARKTYGYEPWPRHLATGLHCSALEIEAPARDLHALRESLESKPEPCPLLKKLVNIDGSNVCTVIGNEQQ